MRRRRRTRRRRRRRSMRRRRTRRRRRGPWEAGKRGLLVQLLAFHSSPGCKKTLF